MCQICLTRGLGLATATTSATFFPHCEQRIRGARLVVVTALHQVGGQLQNAAGRGVEGSLRQREVASRDR
jgi:hypothetical protein